MRYAPLWALLLAAGLSACSTTDPEEDGGLAGSNFISVFEPAPVVPPGGICPTASIPFPFDGLFAGFTGPTLNIPNLPTTATPQGTAFVNDANLTDGFSTSATIFTDFIGFVDLDTAVQGGLLVINTRTLTPLVPGVDYTVSDYPATDVTQNCVGGQFRNAAGDPTPMAPSFGLPINAVRSRLIIHPLKPLDPSTRYLLAITDRLKDTDGNAALASSQFRVVRRDTPVEEQDDPFVSALNDDQRRTLEALRSQSIRPAVRALIDATADTLRLTEDSIALAWTFTTQSAGKTLNLLAENATPQTIVSIPTGRTLQDLNPALPPIADVQVGRVELPYFLANSGLGPLTSFWQADSAEVDENASFIGVDCPAFAGRITLPTGQVLKPSESTTSCFPRPVQQSLESVPLLVTVPNAASGQTRPADGWPVVIFQHGITGNRSQALGIAPALAAAGFVTVAIDLPLHGLTTDNGLAQLTAGVLAQAQAGSVTERTFGLDLINNDTSAPGPDGVEDDSGIHFINLSSLITSRDNLRQAAIDVVHLSKSLSGLTGVGVNTERIHLVGHSLGGIVGTVALGIDDTIGASVIAKSGSGIAKLLDGSKSFGPRISAGLAAATPEIPFRPNQRIREGNDNYETFLRFAQHLADDGDPVNYAAAASADRAIYFIEVEGDLVVPNSVPRTPGNETLDRVVLEGRISGSTPLMQLLGLNILDPITPPLAEAQTPLVGEQLKVGVRFTVGDHGSILSPAASPAATQEIQRQIANFLGSEGTCLPIGGNCNAAP